MTLATPFADVSRETYDKLKTYMSLLEQWQNSINLISPSTLPHIWERHILDSLQLLPLITGKQNKILDVGSGAGFPGLVLAIAGCSHVTLVESDHRKVSFMREVARVTDCTVDIKCQRIESLPPLHPDIITSRACANLSQLLNILCHLVEKNTICLFHKGEKYTKELETASAEWAFDHIIHPSQTDASGVILEISHCERLNHDQNNSHREPEGRGREDHHDR